MNEVNTKSSEYNTKLSKSKTSLSEYEKQKWNFGNAFELSPLACNSYTNDRTSKLSPLI